MGILSCRYIAAEKERSVPHQEADQGAQLWAAALTAFVSKARCRPLLRRPFALRSRDPAAWPRLRSLRQRSARASGHLPDRPTGPGEEPVNRLGRQYSGAVWDRVGAVERLGFQTLRVA